METLYYGDEGIKLILNVEEDISDATKCQIKFRKPNGVRSLWDAVKESDDSISYVIKNGDIDYIGIWKLQAYVETPEWKVHGEEVRIQVLGGL